MDDVSFLALLVHRGHLPRERAEELLPELQGGAGLDALLAERVGWTPQRIARLRRTRGGEQPEIPGYEVGERIGVGGTAEVFRARELATGRTLALKVLKPDCTRHAPTRRAFVAEARMLERLAHPGLVKGYGVARSGDTYFSRLALVDGRTVLEELDDGVRFTEEQALQVVLEAAEVLRYLEGEGIVHRDVKPGNMMRRRDGRIVLIDLGFAAAGDGAASPEDSSVGTVAYLAPEQARGGASADCRSDIYSLGLSLFHVAVGRLPFEGSDDRDVLRRQISESLDSPELRSRNFSPHLHYFIEKMVAKEADDRYQGFAELIEDVREHLAGRDSFDFEREARSQAPRRPRR